jgi:manganese transport protein
VDLSANSEVPAREVQRAAPNRPFALWGAAVLVGVGYIDPGNWATDLEAGGRFGYRLLWVLLASGAIATLLQTLSARLGMVAGIDLARACREHYPRGLSLALWGLAELPPRRDRRWRGSSGACRR